MASRQSTKRDKPKHSAGGRPAKKGGAGGKHVWGSAQDDIRFAGEELQLSKGDPNYDSEDDSEPGVRLSSVDVNEIQSFRDNMDRLAEFKSNVGAAAKEFLHDTHNPDEFINVLRPLLNNEPRFNPQIGKELMARGFDFDEHHQKLVSRLLKRLVDEEIVTPADIVLSVNIILNRLHDYTIDVPNINKYMDGYVKRAQNDNLISEEKAKDYFDVLGTSHDMKAIKELKSKVTAMIKEYLRSQDVENLEEDIVKLDAQFYHKNIVKYAVSIAFDKENTHRDLISAFLARTHDDETPTKLLKRSQVAEGFTLLLYQIDDFSEDVPDVHKLLSNFIARAIQDECLAPSYLDTASFMEGDNGYLVLQRARKLLAQKHAGERILQIWGPNPHSTDALKTAVHALVAEFFSSGNQDAAHKSIQELKAPHFHHEIVLQLFRLCAEKYEKEVANVGELLTSLVKDGVIAPQEIEKGFARVDSDLDRLKEIQPAAESLLEDLRKSVQLK